ncbi:MAG: hypothetical protein ACI9UT_001550, partial [Flavobacteriales bacterium]
FSIFLFRITFFILFAILHQNFNDTLSNGKAE